MKTFTVVKHQKVLNYYLADIQAENKAQALRLAKEEDHDWELAKESEISDPTFLIQLVK